MDELDAEVRGFARRADLDSLPGDEESSGIRRCNAAEDFHERRFTGAVFADDRQYLSWTQFEIYAIQRNHAWETLTDSLHLKHKNGIHCKLNQSSIRGLIDWVCASK